MQSHEAIQSAINGKTVEHAKALHMSSSLIHKWQEPSTDFSDSGALNPLDRIETIIQTSLNLNTPQDKSLAPIHYLAERFGLVMIAVPKSTHCSKEVVRNLLRTIAEFGDLTKAVSGGIEDGEMSRAEARKVDREGWELIRQVAGLMACVKEAAK